MIRKNLPFFTIAILMFFLIGCEPAGQTTTATLSPTTTLTTGSGSSTTNASTTVVTTTNAPTTIVTTTNVTTAPATSEDTSEDVTTTELDSDYLFVPGYLGELSLPDIDQAEPSTFAGLFIESIRRVNDTFGGGTDCEILLSFPTASDIGAETLTLQRYDLGTSAWVNYSSGENYTTDYNNFVLTNPGVLQLRLIANGSDSTGYVSNTITTAHTEIDTYFSSWGLDESMWITGVMTPYVGHGLEANFTVNKLIDGSDVTGGLSYQWYRINPNTYEHTLISGATSLTYTTTVDDVGYYIGIIATGNEETVGGKIEIISGYEPVSYTVEMFVTDASNTGFDIHFDHLLDGLNPEGFLIYDTEYNEVEVISVTQGATAASYHVTIAAPVNNLNLYIGYQDSAWIGITYFEEMHMTRQIVVDLAS